MKRLLTAPACALAVVSLCACEPEAEGVLPGSHPESGRLAISDDGSTLYVALADHDEVRAVDAETGRVLQTTEIAGAPHRLTVLEDGRIAVTAKEAGTVSILDAEAKEVLHSVEVGAYPHGLIEAEGDLVVAVSAQKELARIDLDEPDVVKDRIALDGDDPRGLAIGADGTLFVSHFRESKLSTVDLESGAPSGDVELKMEGNAAFMASQVESITVSPDKSELVVPHQECNNDPEQFGAGGTNLSGGSQVVEYYAQGPTGYPAVIPAISRVDADARLDLSEGPGAYDERHPNGEPEEPGRAPAVISPMDTVRIGENRINLPVATALADGGSLEITVNKGSGNVFLRRSQLGQGDRALVGVIDVGVGASDIVLSPDGSRAYVFNEFSYEITEFDVPKVDVTTGSPGSSLSQFSAEDTWGFTTGARAIRNLEPSARHQVAESVLPADVEAGRVLFHSVTPNLASNGAISCASCHPEGRDDGTTWNFQEGPRQTPPLWGGLSETVPLHWDNTFSRGFDDINSITVQMRMGGEGLNSSELSQLVAYIDTIPAAPAPMNLDEDMVDRGREIFFSEETGCTECHYGAKYTDNLAHDVGTGWGRVTGETLTRFATPPLKGLASTAPYFHTGQAKTLRQLVDQIADGAVDMGNASHLDEQGKDDLAAFLSTL